VPIDKSFGVVGEYQEYNLQYSCLRTLGGVLPRSKADRLTSLNLQERVKLDMDEIKLNQYPRP
jgi:hypothetical protein